LRQDLSGDPADGLGAALVNGVVIRVTSIAAMEAYSAPVGYVFSLNAGGRSGVFDVVAGDFSTELAADTLNGIYVGQADDPTATTKVLKRRYGAAGYLSWFGVFGDGVTVDSGIINSALSVSSSNGINFLYGDKGKSYLLEDTVDLSGISNITLDFNFAVVIDNVQGVIAASANRAKQAFIIYNNENVKLKNFSYVVAATRETNADKDIPDILIWVGGQYLGAEVTVNTEVSNIVFTGTTIGNMPISVLGEHRGFKCSNIDIYGDAGYGINFEYGLQPSDPITDPGLENGRHPYNAKVENVNGYNLLNCNGFLRVASSYNILFKNCQMFNVPFAIYCYGGDRNISRFSENVRFVNCKSKINEAILTDINYGIYIIIPNKDGSTGDDLPAFTNYNQSFQFDNCEIWNNTTEFSSCVRFVGNQGQTTFNNCIFKRSYYGIWAEPSGNPTYRSRYSLSLKQCDFINNYQDVELNGIDGVSFQGVKFIGQVSAATGPQVFIGSSVSANYTKFTDCFFGEQSKSQILLRVFIGEGTQLTRNRFETFSSGDTAISLSSKTFGYGNTTNGYLVSTFNTAFRIIGEDSTGLKNTSGLSGSSLNFLSGDIWVANSTLVLDFLENGEKGDRVIFRGGASGASITFNNLSNGEGKFYNLSNSDDTLTGNLWSKEFVYSGAIWYEI
jgi:hypothetical protein